MTHRLAGGVILAVSILVVTAAGAEELKSGLQVGKYMPSPLPALHINGSMTGAKF